MLLRDIFLEDFGLARKNVWTVKDGKTTHREISAVAATLSPTPRTGVEPSDEERHDD